MPMRYRQKKITDFNVLLSIVHSILSLGSGNNLLDLLDFMHYRQIVNVDTNLQSQ